MEEVIKYFESLESRIAAQEALRESLEARLAAAEERLAAQKEQIAALQAEVTELQNRPLPEPQVVEKVVEKIVEKPVVVAAPVAEPEPVVEEAPKVEEPEVIAEPEPEPVAEPVIEEQASPKAAIYGKAVDDIRLAISLGDRFLYQRELFGQNAELMQRTLTELNALHSFDEAMSYISRFGWDTESNSYQQFIVTLHRRFG